MLQPPACVWHRCIATLNNDREMLNEPFSRRRFLKTLTAVAGVSMLGACDTSDQTITIATHMWPGYEPLSLASDLGWLDKQLVKLIETDSATDSIKLLEAGKIDGAGLTLDEVLRIRATGMPLSILLVCDISAGADMLLVRPEIKQLSELKGKRIGVEDGALGTLMLYEILQAAGLKRSDVRTVSLTIDQQIGAWQRGEIDAAVTFEPSSRSIKAQGGKLLFDSRQIPELIFDVIAVRSNLLDKQHSAALHHLTEMQLKALQHLTINPNDAAYRMSARLKLPAEEVMSTFKGLILPDLNNNIRLLAGEHPVLLDSAQRVSKAMHEAGILHSDTAMNDLIHPEYLPRKAQ